MTTNLTDAIKEKIADYVLEAVGGLVSTDWNIQISLIREHKRPICTIKLEPIKWSDPTYDRLMPEPGGGAQFNFTIYVFDDRDRGQAGEHPADWAAMDDAELIMDKFIEKNDDLTERVNNNIIRIYDINIKEAPTEEKNKTKQRALSIYMLTARVDAKWIDS